MDEQIKAIETHYDGYRFRSRLEARWAVFFNSLRIPYEYEKEGFMVDGKPYLPDFYLPRQDVWVEVKPNETHKAYEGFDTVQEFFKSSGFRCLLLIGPPGSSADVLWWQLKENNALFIKGCFSLGFDKFKRECCLWFFSVSLDETGKYRQLEMHDLEPVDFKAKRSALYPRLNHHRLLKAYEEARSARFEHRETPAITSAAPNRTRRRLK